MAETDVDYRQIGDELEQRDLKTRYWDARDKSQKRLKIEEMKVC